MQPHLTCTLVQRLEITHHLNKDNHTHCSRAWQVAGYRARIQQERWDTAAWEALVAETSEAAERTPSPELLAEQKAALEEFLEAFPTAVSLHKNRDWCLVPSAFLKDT